MPACPAIAALVYGMVCTVQVARVVDGDTFVAAFASHEPENVSHNAGSVSSERHNVRVVGIDTPERGEPGWAEATEAARSAYEGRTATLRIGGAASRTSAATGRRCVGEAVFDRYGRVLASISSWNSIVSKWDKGAWCN